MDSMIQHIFMGPMLLFFVTFIPAIAYVGAKKILATSSEEMLSEDFSKPMWNQAIVLLIVLSACFMPILLSWKWNVQADGFQLDLSLILVSLFSSLASFAIIQWADISIGSASRLSNNLEIPVLGQVIEKENLKSEMFALKERIRSSVIREDNSDKLTLMGISNFENEGKNLCMNELAIAFSKTYEKVLLVEGDLWSSYDNKVLTPTERATKKGLSDALRGNVSVMDCVLYPNHDNLALLPRGSACQNPSELLSSNQMNVLMDFLRDEFTVVLIDLPSIRNCPDLSNIISQQSVFLLFCSESSAFQDFELQLNKMKQSNVLDRSCVVVTGAI